MHEFAHEFTDRKISPWSGIKGYNPAKRGRPSHHPIMAFCDELKMVVNAWMRTGNSHSVTDAKEFLEEVFQIVSRSNVGLLRGDVGFYSNKIMSYLEETDNPVSYIFKAKMTSALMARNLKIRKWHSNDSVVKGACYAEFDYQATKWKKPRRIAVVRIPKRKDPYRQKELFEEYEQLNEYEFMAFVSTLSSSTFQIHRSYTERGDCENRIKELKYDFGIDGFALQNFGAMEAAFRFQWWQIISRPFLSRQCIAIGSYLVTSGEKRK